jgi:hypothetical protein
VFSVFPWQKQSFNKTLKTQNGECFHSPFHYNYKSPYRCNPIICVINFSNIAQKHQLGYQRSFVLVYLQSGDAQSCEPIYHL